MEKVKSYAKIVLGALIIGAGMNLFFKDFNFAPAGIFGFDVIYSAKTGESLAKTVLVFNVFFILLGVITLNRKAVRKSILSSFLVPLFVLITSNLSSIIDVSSADKLLISIFGGVVLGFGYTLIYGEHRFVCVRDIIGKISKTIIGPTGEYIIYLVDIFALVYVYLCFGIDATMYSLVSMIIIEYMVQRSYIGISDAKVFYIITKEESKVKKFIMNELHYDLTIFDVRGGYSKNKNKVLMSVIPTKDYYKLREGIKNIDPDAFISITDSFEIINENVAINK